MAAGEEEQPAKKHFDIPADAADKSLQTFSVQSGADVVFAPEKVAGVKANALKGEYAPLEAVKLLLAGTGLSVSQEGTNGAFLVNRVSDPNVQRVVQETANAHPVKARTADSVESLQQFVVTGTRMDLDQLQTPITITSLSRGDFEGTPALSFQDIMAKVPGLQIGAQGGTFLRFATRGFRLTSDVLVLIDGVPFRQVNGNSDLINIPLGLVDHVEYAKGPGSSTYGRDAVGGVVQIFTDAPRQETTSGEVSVDGGSFGTYNAYVRAMVPTPGGAINFASGANWSQGWQDRTSRNQQFLKLSDEQKINDKLDVRASYFLSHFFTYRSGVVPLLNGDPAYGIDRTANYAVPETDFKTNYQSFTLTPKLSLGEWTITDIANYSRYLKYFTGGVQVSSQKGFNQSYSEQFTINDIMFNDLSAAWVHKFGDVKNTFLFGGTGEWGHLTQVDVAFSSQPTYNPPDFINPASNAAFAPYGVRQPQVVTWFSQPIYSAYMEERAEWNNLSFLAGLRYDRAQQTYTNSSLNNSGQQTISATSPRVSATYQFHQSGTSETSAFASYSKSFKPQAAGANTLNGVTVFTLLAPETAESYEFGVKGYNDHRRIFWQAGVYEIDRTNAQRFFRVNTDTYLSANAAQRVRGFEGALDFRTSNWLSFYLHYAYTNAVNVSFITPTTNLSGLQVAMNPRNTAGAGVTLTHGNVSLNVMSNFTGTRPLRDDLVNAQVLPSYLITNVAVTYTYKNTMFQAGVQNVTNAYYISDNLNSLNEGQPGAPRSFFGRVTYHF